MVRKLPKNCRDWHPDLIRCAETRYNKRSRTGKRDFGEWMKARDLLRASQDPIYIQPTGEYKDQIIGIPKKIGQAINNYLVQVVRGEKPVVDPDGELPPMPVLNIVDHEGVPIPQPQLAVEEDGEAFIENTPIFHRRRYRDSMYAVLASMYTQLQPDMHHELKTFQVENGMQPFTDLQVKSDYRSNKQGAFKASSDMAEKGIINKVKHRGGFGSGNFFSLTQRGLRLCYHLFHTKFDPSINPAYALVRPRAPCVATAEGHIQMTGPNPGVMRMGAAAAIGERGGVGAGFGVGYDAFHNMHNDHAYESEDDDLPYGMGGMGGLLATPNNNTNKRNTRDWDDIHTNTHINAYNNAHNTPYKREHEEAVDVDALRFKRLRHFEPLGASATGSAVKPASTPTTHTTTTTLADADSQRELEEGEWQSLLLFSEQQARQEAARRDKVEREEEAHALQLARLLAETEAQANQGQGDRSAQVSQRGSEDVYEVRQELYLNGVRIPDTTHTCNTTSSGNNPGSRITSNVSNDTGSDAAGGGGSDDEDYRRAVALSLLTASAAKKGSGGSTGGAGSSKKGSTITGGSNVSGTVATPARAPAVAPPRPQPADTSPGEVVYIDTPVKLTSVRAHTSLSTRTPATPYATTSNTSAGSGVHASRREVICVLDDSQDSPIGTSNRTHSTAATSTARSPRNTSGTASTQAPAFTPLRTTPRTVIDVDEYPPTPPSNAPTTAGSALRTLPASEVRASSGEVVEVDASQSRSSSRIPTPTTHNKRPTHTTHTAGTPHATHSIPSARRALDVIVLEDSQPQDSEPENPRPSGNEESPEVRVLPARECSSSATAVATTGSTNTNTAPSTLRAVVVGSVDVANTATTAACTTLRRLPTVTEIDVTPSPVRTAPPSFSDREVITLDDSQPQYDNSGYQAYGEYNEYDEYYTDDDTNTNNNTTNESQDSVVYISESAAEHSSEHNDIIIISNSSGDKSSYGSSTGSGGGSTVRTSALLAVLTVRANQRNNNTSGTSSGSVANFPHDTLHPTLPTALLPSPLALTTTLYPQPHAHAIPSIAVPVSARRRLVLLLDVRERASQEFYRKFLFDIQAKCSAHLSTSSGSSGGVEWRVEQDKLDIGDVAFAFEDTVTATTASTTPAQYLSGLLVERKAVADLVSRSAGTARSRCGTAAHVVQEARLRHVSGAFSRGSVVEGTTALPATSSPRSNAFMLVEGVLTAAGMSAVPLVWHESDLAHPDVVDSAEGVVSYLCSVVARNCSVTNRVRVLQSVNNSATCLLLSALMAVEMHTTLTNTVDTISNSTAPALPTKEVVEKYCRAFGASKRGKEAALRQSLQEPISTYLSASAQNTAATAGSAEDVVSAEMEERLVRRFGCWDALLDAYKLCYTHAAVRVCSGDSASSGEYGVNIHSEAAVGAETRCALMLCELSVGGTQADRDIITDTNNTSNNDAPCTLLDDSQQSVDPDLVRPDSAAGARMLQDSLLVWSLARALLTKEGFMYNASSGGSSSSSTTLSPVVAQYLHTLHNALLCVIPRKATLVTLSASMAAGVMCHYCSLHSADFMCTVLPTTSTTSTTGVNSYSSVSDEESNPRPKRRKAEVTPGGSCTYLNCADQRNPYMCVQSVDSQLYSATDCTTTAKHCNTIQRCSLRSVVAVVSAFDVMEALVLATAAYKTQHRSEVRGVDWSRVSVFADSGRCVDVVSCAVTQLAERLPAEFTASGDNTVASGASIAAAPAQCVLIVEGLVHPTSQASTAAGKLEAATNTASASNLTQVSLGPGRPVLSLGEARDVSANHAWLLQLFVAVVSMRGSSGGGWQCYLTYNADQTERYLYSLIHETHRQSLLLY